MPNTFNSERARGTWTKNSLIDDSLFSSDRTRASKETLGGSNNPPSKEKNDDIYFQDLVRKVTMIYMGTK